MKPELHITPTYTDLYQLSMGQVYYLTGDYTQDAAFDYFFRKLPYGGGYTVFAGLDDVLELISEFSFSKADLDYLRSIGLNKEYVDHLAGFRFTGKIYAVQEGDIIFPNVPAIRVEGNILEAQLIETVLLNLVNFQSLIATKAARMKQVVGDRVLLDFGLRRAQGLGGYHASRACAIGGFQATSNVKAAGDFDIRPSGTMGHSFIQHFGDELAAFRKFAEGRPENCVFLVDTYDTLKSGVPNAIIVAKEMEARGQRLDGIRLDSGDLAYLSRHARKMLDAAGLDYVKIAASNQLDEWVIKSLLEQEAPIDVFGVGTNLVTGQPDAALDGVYKLCYSNGKPRIKLSESLSKTTLPHKKQVFRVIDNEGMFFGADVIALEDEDNVEMMHHPIEPGKSMTFKGFRKEPLLKLVMDGGQILQPKKSLSKIAAYSRERLALLPPEYKRFQNPHVYKVGISSSLQQLRDDLRNQYLNKV